MFACAVGWLLAAWPWVLLAVALVAVGRMVCVPRLGRIGPPAPGGLSLADLLEDGRCDGVPVREEPAGRFGAGRYVPEAGEIRLSEGMLARRDVDALMILAHERTHAARDWPAPRWYRLGLVVLFLLALALGLNGRLDAATAGTIMVGAYLLAAGHVLRNELVASVGALQLTTGWPAAEIRAARARLATAYGVYLGDWAAVGLAVLAGLACLGCR